MLRSSSCLLALGAAILLSACGDDTAGPDRRDAAFADAAPHPTIDATAIDGAGSEGGAPHPTGIVVVNSDYSASSISLLDLDGNVLHGGCLSSGSGPAGVTMALSSDVVLPTQVPAGGPVALIDRGNNVITWLDPTTCGVLGQLNVGTGFAADPHDYVPLSASKAYVTREATNLKPTAAPGDFDDGNDVLIVDPSQQKIVGRIDLLPFAPAGVLPRADRALWVLGKVFVSLNAVTVDYKTYATGRVVIIDPTTDQVTGTVDLPGLQNCGAMTYSADQQALLVACNGAYSTDRAVQAAGSGIASIAVTKTPPVAIEKVMATTLGPAPLSNLSLATIDGIVALTVADGAFGTPPPDSLWALPVLPSYKLPYGPVATKVFDSAEGYAIGAVLYDREHDRVLATDAPTNSAASLRMFTRSADGYSAWKSVTTDTKYNLPPRALSFY
jgi:hypothetical protein